MPLFGDVGKFYGDTWADIKQYIPGLGDAQAQEDANAMNLAESKLNREFQERMSNTAYQRSTMDMRKAGINPMLAFSQGGASTPSGSTATVSPASKTGLANMALQAYTGISSQQNAAKGLQQQQSMNESSIKLNAANAAKNVADTENIRADTQLKKIDTELKKKDVPFAQLKGQASNKVTEIIKSLYGMMDQSAKDTSRRNKIEDQKNPLIKSPKDGGYKPNKLNFKNSIAPH